MPRASQEMKEHQVALHRIHSRLAKRERAELEVDVTPHLSKVLYKECRTVKKRHGDVF